MHMCAQMLSRSIVAILVVALPLQFSCSHVKEVPIEEVGSGKTDPKTPYRLHTTDGTVYITREFLVTDSTFVIKDLSPSDPKYSQVTLPIVLSSTSVTRIEKSEAGFGSYAVIAIIGLVAIAVTVGSSGWGSD